MSTGRPELSAVPCSLRWTAPEILRHAQAHESPDSDVITPACDVYSYGMLMWEICTTLDPFSDVTADEQVIAAVLAGSRPPIDVLTDVHQEYIDLMLLCWEQHPKRRPASKEVGTGL